MERTFEDFLVHGGGQSEYNLKYLTKLLGKSSQLPPHIVDILQSIRLHAEEDYSNFLHLQSILPLHRGEGAPRRGDGLLGRGATRLPVPPLREAVPIYEGGQLVGGEMDADIETAIAAGDDQFLLEGVNDSMSPQSLTFSDGDGEESDGDEGIHLPRKHQKPQAEIAASLPVGIPWPEQLTSRRSLLPRNVEDEDERPADIAASIQAMARSVHTSSMFGDSVFGDLPRPRLNTASKQ